MDAGHEVVSIFDINPQASDEEVLELSLQEERILITKDKDFGDLVFLHHLPHGTIVRLVEMGIEEEVAAIQELIKSFGKELQAGAIIVATRNRIRIKTE
jgi:predicted nuclease of predicted toxin-antitoxin system